MFNLDWLVENLDAMSGGHGSLIVGVAIVLLAIAAVWYMFFS